MIKLSKYLVFLALGALVATLAPVCEAADGFAITPPLSGRAVVSCSNITMSGSAVIDSAGVASGSSSPVNKGNVATNGNITLSGSATVQGDVIVGPSKHVTTSGTAHVTGTTTVATSAFGCQPVDLVALKNIVQTTNNNSTIPQTTHNHNPLSGANHTDFVMSGTDGITLAAGTYYFTSVSISGSSVITLSGPVHILCSGTVSISGGSVVSNNGYGLHFWVSGASFSLSSSTFKAFVYAPSASASLSNSTLTGSLFANTVSVSGSSHVTRAIDDLAPHVTITSPADNSVAADPAHVLVKGTASDVETDVTVLVNGQAVSVAADGTWQITLNLSSGASPAAVAAVATDVAGNTATATIHVVTGPPPVITLTTPAPGSFINTRTANLSGSAGTAASVTVNGTAATIAGGTWTRNAFDLGNDGAHTLTIVGTNASGSTTISPIITNDTTLPTVSTTVTPSPNAAGWNKNSATVSFTCTDATSGIATCPAAVTVSVQTASQTVSGTATDRAGNQKAASVIVKLDTAAPLVAITSPASGATVTSSTLSVSGTVSDSLSGVAGVTCNGATATINGDTFSCGVTLVAGSNTITTIATDVAGNTASATRQVTYNPDSQAPVITITAPANNSFTRLTSVTVSGTATDDVAVAGVTVNGTAVTLTNGTWTTTLNLTGPDGAKTIAAIATDTSNKTTTATAQITLDTTAPLVAITSPADGTSGTSPTLAVSGTVSDTLSGVTGVTCNGVAAAVSGGSYTCTVSLVPGSNSITATAADVAGNTAAATIHATYTPDTEAPVITITAPAAGTFTRDTTVAVSGTASDDVAVASVTVNGATVPLNGGAWSTPVTLTTGDGAKTITAIATDTTGKSTTATVLISLDTTAPIVAITSPANGTSGTSSTVTVTGSVSDALSGVAGVKCNAVQAVTSSGTFTCSVTLVPGDNQIEAVATDVAGNTAANTIHVTYTPDLQAPVIAITAPVAGTFTRNGTITVSGTASDDVAVAKVTVENVEVPFANGAWTTTVTLTGADGPRTLTAVATDVTGKQSSAQVQIGLDTTAPAVTITAPPDHSSGTSSSITVSGTVSDALSGVATVTCNGTAATLSGGTFSCLVTLVPGDNPIIVAATDNAGNEADATTHAVFTPDSQAPAIAITAPANGVFTKETAVIVSGTATDDVAVARVTVNDVEVPFANGTWTTTLTLSGSDGPKTITAVATDTTGKPAQASIQVNLDTTPPAVVIVTPADQTTVANPVLTISGTVSDALSGLAGVTCGGAAATIASGTFTCNVALLEGSNTVAIVAADNAGNQAAPALTVTLDTRAPEVVVLAPVANSCVNSASLQVGGRASDPHLGTIKISITPDAGSTTVTPAADGTFSATLPLGADGRYVVVIEAADASGHTAVATIPLTVDRTEPAIEITSSGAAFTGGAFNRPIIINVRGVDADPAVAVTTTLGSASFVSGTTISAEGQYTLNAAARDCAGNTKQSSVTFKIDTTAPQITSVAPATGSTVSIAATAITGVVNADDVTSIVVEGTSTAATLTGRNFTISPNLNEGTNNLVLAVTDDAGNSSRQSYTINLKTTTPSVQILESGLPFPAGAIYNRNVTPVVKANETAAHVTATLDTASFASGTEVSAEGAHTIVAHASDDYGHQSDATATFTIDKTPPVLTITEPADNATISTATVDVKGTAAGASSVSVNGVAATLGANSSFSATIALDPGANAILVNALDAAGNAASAARNVTSDDNRPGLVLTTPGNGMVTNHATIAVAGQVLTPSLGAHVTINGTDVTPDASGGFRIDAFPLHDGDNAITAAIAGTSRSVTINVTSDIIPPALKVMANGVEMQPAARFATSPQITLQATDNNPAGLTTTLTIDGVDVTGATPAIADGGHVLVAIARDAARNQTRVDRTFSVGSSSTAAAGCALTAFDPADGAAVFSNSITFSGRSGGALGVLVNGAHAAVDAGSFSSSLALTSEGANTITVRCTDATGTPTSDAAVTLTIYRYTNTPSIAITAPVNDAQVSSSTVTVTGTIGADVISGDVNGIPFTPAGGAFSVPGVSLATGLNIITAHGRNAAGRAGIATVRVVVSNGAPTITITSPLPATQTSATTIDVSGTYTNIDPTTLRVASLTATTKATSDTTGTFAANVPLNPNATTTIPVTGQNAAAKQATASVDVENLAGPSISIATPPDNTFYRADVTSPDAITGTISAVPGSTVAVNGVAATVTGNQFTATINFQASTSGSTPVIARVSTPDGASATDSIRIVRLPAGLSVTRSFPDADAASVDAGTLVVVLFSNPLDGSTARGAVSLADDAGPAITGTTFVDKDAISFAPNVPLEAGRSYTFTVSVALKDLAGQSLATPFALHFTTATTAPATAPVVTDSGVQQGCLTSATIKGTASAAGARVRLTVDGLSTTTVAAADKSFTFTVGLSGQPGYHVARLREVGTDGTLSPETDVLYQIDCGGPSGPTVTAAALDRSTKTLTIQFSKAMNATTLTASPAGSIQLGTLSGNVVMNVANDVAVVTSSGDLSAALTLTVTTGAKDTTGAPLASNYLQSFPVDSQTAGNGFITGAVYDASNGRPLQGVAVVITPSTIGSTTTDDHGRYSTPSLGEGAFTIEASANGFTKVWRQVVVPAGSGVVPIDIRLTSRGADQNSGVDRTLTHGGDTSVTRPAELFVPSAALASGHTIALTAVGGQSLAGLLPLGWSPIAAAEIAIDSSSLPLTIPASKLTFVINSDDIAALAAATQTLSLVQYDSARDEWRTVVAAVTVGTDGRITSDIQTSGNYALVYPDKGTNLTVPSTPRSGTALQGVPNPCGTPDVCRVSRKSFTIDPPSVTPNGRATATLTTEGTDKTYPSGTAVQAYIDEQLNLADGTVTNSAPFATDLLLYRSMKSDTASAVFHVAPSSDAAKATLRDGVDHIRVVDYPGRIDRGTLIGSEGGRVPGDDTISIDIPAGATSEAIHAAIAPMTPSDLQTIGTVAGFHVAGGFTFSLTRSDTVATVDIDGDGKPDVIPATLLKPAKGTFTVDLSKFTTSNRQVVIAELIDKSSYGTLVRLAATTTAVTTPASGVRIVSTDDVNPATLPVDGILRDGRYLILTADAPVAYAWGQVRLGSATGSTVLNALVTSATGSAFDAPFGVRDITRSGGVFAIPVVAQPASSFALKPRTFATGDGDVTTAAAPAPDAKVPVGALVLAPLPLHLLGITPDNQEVPTSGFQAVATFNIAVDHTSVAGGIVVTNVTTGTAVAGTVTGDDSIHVTFTPAQPLASGSRYTIAVNPTIRSMAGLALGIGGSASFTTPAAPPANSGIDRSKIQITIPENGLATIRGTAGALPVGDIAVAVRRNQFFIEQYQRQVGSDNTTDGSFTFAIGSTTGPDRVTTADRIDLQVQDRVSGSIVAVIALTPFVTPDGLGFIAPSDLSVTFTAAPPLNVSVTVPAGAFDVPTLVTIAASPKSDYAAVPSFDSELNFYTAVTLNFDGMAKKPLELDIPVPAGTDTTGKTFLLGRLGDSSRGPRIEIDDLITVVDGKFTTRAQGATSGQIVTKSLSVKTQNVVVGNDARTYLLRTIESGKYTVIDIRVPSASTLGWGAMDGLQSNLDLFMDLYNSLFVSQLYITAGHGRVVIPVATGTPFTVQGVDAATGIQLFEHHYDAIQPAAPGTVTGIPGLVANTTGPYPVFGDPFAIQTTEVIGGIDSITSVPGVTIDTSRIAANGEGNVTVAFNSTPDTQDPPRHLRVYNVRSGDLSGDFSQNAPIYAKAGDRLVIFTQSDRIDSRSDISVVFNEAIGLPVDPTTGLPIDPTTVSQEAFDAAMRPLFELHKKNPDQPNAPWEIVGQTTFKVDSGNRRVMIHADLQSGQEYLLHLSETISDADSGTALKLMQGVDGTTTSAGSATDLYFAVRDPKGKLTDPFNIKHGNVRDLALDGNLLFVSAQEGGLFAYDASDPASLASDSTRKSSWAQALGGSSGGGESWAVTLDNHGRVWTTALTPMFGVVRTFRTEDFVNKLAIAGATDPEPVAPFAGGTVSWRTGVTTGIDEGLSTTLLSDRPEATPRKMQLVVQDDAVELVAGTDLDAKLQDGSNALLATGHIVNPSVDGEFAEYTISVQSSPGQTIPAPTGYPYISQRITVRNVTAGLRWSMDRLAGPFEAHEAKFDHVLVRGGDHIRIERNMRTYGVISLFGYGLGMYDLNAIESNSRMAAFDGTPFGAAGLPAVPYNKLGNLVGLTSLDGQLTFSPDAVVYADPAGSPTLTSVACVPTKGVAIYSAAPRTSEDPDTPLEANGPTSDVPSEAVLFPLADTDDTLKAIKQLFDNAGRSMFGRFNSIVRYDVNKPDLHSYALVSGGQYGILVLNTDNPLLPKLVDIIWVATGAWAVRYIGNNFATSIDGAGRTLLIDLSRLDESALTGFSPCGGCAAVFPTLFASLKAGPRAGLIPTFGTDDPRIVWRGETDPLMTNTTLAAVGDPDTGFLFGGTILQSLIRTEAGIDPHITLKANLAEGLRSVTSIVPLGIQPNRAVSLPIGQLSPCASSGLDVQQPTQCRENASQGVFRVEMNLPGSVTAGTIDVALESERIPGGLTEQTLDPLPPSHLRQRKPAGASGGSGALDSRPTTFSLRRVLSDSTVAAAAQKGLRLQKGFNRFVSPWVIAIADPRASSKYTWAPNDNDTRENAGCFQCTTPPFLTATSSGKTLGTDYFELYTLGRYITIRPESNFFPSGSPYAYLGDPHRFFARFATISADTVRPPQALVAAQAPPVATGKIQETVYLHSGEVETSTVDLDAGGRAGWNVVFDRTYRSRTVGFTPFGPGWDSSIFARLRQLPSGDVEYRDGSGEVWLFLSGGNGTYTAPKGLFLNLVHTEQGWTLIDQKRRITFFDEFGRIVKSTDEFFKPSGEGNVIRYSYDQNGRLSGVTDPVDRTTTITYGTTQAEEGSVKKLTDWWTAARKVDYDYYANGTLKEAHLPQFSTQSGTSFQPTRHYDYDSATGSYADKVELATNLKNVIDPNEAPSGTARVTFTYGGSVPRDYAATQTWGGSSGQVLFGYTPGVSAQTTDLLGQIRNYTFQTPTPPDNDKRYLWYANDRPHIHTLTEQAIEISSTSYGTIPSSPPDPTSAPVTTVARETTYGYNDDGTPQFANVTSGPQVSFGYTSAGSNLGTVTNQVVTSGAGESVTIDYGFEGDNTAFLKSIKANDAPVSQTEAHRDNLNLVDINSTTATSTYDAQGRATKIVGTGGNATCTSDCGATTTIKYPQQSASTAKHERGLPEHVSEGANEDVKTRFEYPSETETKATDARDVLTDTIYDTWRRPIDVKVSSSDSLTMEDQYDYDASGHLHEHRRMQDGQWIKTTFAYDPIGRTTSITTDHVATDGTPTVETYDYSQFPTGTIKHFTAGTTIGNGAETDITLDSLGRTKRTETLVVGSGTTNIITLSAYDIAGNPVYTLDAQKFATAMAYDASGRRTDVMHTDGSVEHFDYDGWGHVKFSTRKAKDGTVIYSRTTPYTADGQLPTVTETGAGPGAGSRTTNRAWDGGGRTAGVSVTASDAPEARAALQEYDSAGRIQSAKAGSGSQTSLATTFTEANWSDYGDYLAAKVSTTERKVAPGDSQQTFESQRDFDTAGNAKNVTVGDLNWDAEFDEAGNVKTAQEPGQRGEARMSHNAAGAVTTETLADGTSQQSHEYFNTGSGKAFTDPKGIPEVTSVIPDNLGRPLVITYEADGTTQEIHYEGARVKAVKDRQDRWQSFVYDGGHLTEIWDSPNPGDGNKLDKIEYDGAGRVQHWTTPDAKIDYDNFTLDGLPQSTAQTRYKNHSGLGSQDVLDSFSQTHGYNGHGERTSYSVPGGVPGGTAGWSSGVTVHYDVMGNIDLMSTDGGFALTGDYRAAGRPNSRKITLPMAGGTSKTLERTYQYKQGTGQLLEMKAMVGNIPVAGSTVHYDGLLVDDAALIGVSGGVRHTRHSYDRRGRLSGSVVAAAPEVQAPAPGAAASAPGSTSEALDPADFRTGQTRAPLLDPTVASLLQSRGIDTAAIDPPSQSAMPARGHKIATFTRGASTRTFDFALKSELVDDGLFRYHYDAKGRLDWAAEKATATGVVIRRILYAYDGNNRLVGRTAQSATVTSLTANYDTFAWSLETRQAILDADGIPAETTFVWDPISDRIITVVRAGDSKIASDPNNNVLKQIIHGDMGYDDPLEVTTLDAAALVAPGQPKPVTKLYPIYDEAAGGTLQVVVNRDGEVVARSVNNDPFGGSEFDLAGAAIDHVEIQTKKRADGALDSVAVTMRATEPLATASVASGARLAVVDANGALVRPSTVEPALAANDPFTVTWTLSAAEWTALSDATAVNNRTPVALSIAATDTLHAALWRFDLPILPAPDWATTSQPVFSSTTLPVEVREPLAAISSTIAALTPNEFKTTTPYDVPNLSLVGTSGNSEVESLLAATFQAQPFAEPFTHKFYVRERWYDPMTGTWLSPDPLGYVDSANLYAYAGGDPVNRRDPRGEATNLEKGAAGEAALFQWLRDEGWKVIQGPGHRTNAGGADAVAYLPGKTVAYNVNTGEMELVDGEMGVVTFFDDKNWARKKIGKAPALTENFERGENVENAIEAVTKSEELSSVEKAQIIQILRDGNFQKLISSAAKESKVEGITTLLKKKGIGFLSKNKVNIVIAIIVAAFAEDKTEAFVEALDPVAAISGGTEVASSKEESHSVLEVNAFRPLIRELRRRGVNVGGPHTPHPTAPISAEDDKRRLEELEKNVWKGMGPK